MREACTNAHILRNLSVVHSSLCSHTHESSSEFDWLAQVFNTSGGSEWQSIFRQTMHLYWIFALFVLFKAAVGQTPSNLCKTFKTTKIVLIVQLLH